MANMTLHQVKKTLNEGNKNGQVKLSFHLKMIKVNGQVRGCSGCSGCSGFVENTENGKIVYINTEVLPFTGQEYRVLYRTAKHLKDFTGGFNQYATPAKLAEKVIELLK